MRAKPKLITKPVYLGTTVPPHPAIDSNEAAKQDGKAIPLDKDDIAILDTLLASFSQLQAQTQEANRRAELFADRIATAKGIKLVDYNLNWDLKAFVRKPQP